MSLERASPIGGACGIEVVDCLSHRLTTGFPVPKAISSSDSAGAESQWDERLRRLKNRSGCSERSRKNQYRSSASSQLYSYPSDANAKILLSITADHSRVH